MYFGTTKMYYRKTIVHVFTKLAQIEGTTQNFLVLSLIFLKYRAFHNVLRDYKKLF